MIIVAHAYHTHPNLAIAVKFHQICRLNTVTENNKITNTGMDIK